MHGFLNDATKIAQQSMGELPWESLKKLNDSYIEILKKTNQFVLAANSLATDRKETYEKRHRWCTYANYFLYTAILILTLIGKMIGVDIVS
jgi:hypothetical protein